MDSLPDAILKNILSNISSAKDVASCNRVSKNWKDSMTNLKRLCFPRGTFKNLKSGQTPDCIVKQMVSSISRLEELVVSCQFTSVGLASWLLLAGSSLKNLDLRIDYACDDSLNKLECIQTARKLESLRLRDVLIVHTPKWDSFKELRNLEIVGAKLEDSVLTEALRMTPNLIQLVLECEGLSTIWIELLELRHCELDFYNRDCSLTLNAPKIEYLEVQGCVRISVPETKCLKNLSIANDHGLRYKLELGKLMALESLSCQGYKWSWNDVSKMLQFASKVKHISINISRFLRFPGIDFVDFFKSHPKLTSFDIRGAMVDALSQNNSLKNVNSSFVIPCLEEVVITLLWPPNGEQDIRLIESFAKYGKKIKKMTIEVIASGSGHSRINDFLDDIRSTVDHFFKETRKIRYKDCELVTGHLMLYAGH